MSSDRQRKVGLALGGGGVRGLAHIGVLKALEREGIPIHAIAGTSMGGLVGALYASGMPVERMIAEVQERLSKGWELARMVDLRLTQGGLVKGARIYNYLAEQIGEELTFSDLLMALATIAVDLNSGREVVLREGRVVDAVRATISVPGVFEPVDLGPYRFIDGGVLNNVPVDVARLLGADVVIAVDVLPDFTRNQPGQAPTVKPLLPSVLPKTLREGYHVAMIMLAALTDLRLRESQPDVILRPDLADDVFLFLGFERAAEVVAAGEAAAVAAMPRIKERVSAAPHRWRLPRLGRD